MTRPLDTVHDILQGVVCSKCGRKYPDMSVGPWEVGKNMAGELEPKDTYHIHHNHGARDTFQAIYKGRRGAVSVTEKQEMVLGAAKRACGGELDIPIRSKDIHRESGLESHAFITILASLYTKGLLFRMKRSETRTREVWTRFTKAGKDAIR